MIELAPHDLCTGCSACLNACNHSAIMMQADDEGFVYPVINENACIECGLCVKKCPILFPLQQQAEDIPKVFALWSHPDRTVSSSGGAFSAFARLVLNQGGVVFGAAFDEKLHLRHIGIEQIENLPALRGSKYIQSEIGSTYKEIRQHLKDGRKVLFCGTPCQVAGLKSFLRKPDENLLTLELVCHGVPSDAVFQSYLKKISSREAAFPNGYEFRDRDGWGFAPSVSVCGKFRPVYGVDALYMEAFNASALFRKSCYQCPYSCIPRMGDCTLGDFWGIGRHGKPFKHNTMKGVSLILVNTAQGANALRELTDCFVEERTLEEALIENHNITKSSILHPKREEIIQAFLAPDKSLQDIDKEFALVDRSLKGRIKQIASKWHVFDLVKCIYNKYKTL